MQEEKDYIQREIQRLTLLLKKLIGKALGIKSNDFEQGIQNIESDPTDTGRGLNSQEGAT